MAKFAPPPIQTPMLDDKGLPSPVWSAYFTGLNAQLENSPLQALAWQPWAPVIYGSGSMVLSSINVYTAQYIQLGPVCLVELYFDCVLSGTMSNSVLVDLPIGLPALDGTTQLAAAIATSAALLQASPALAWIVRASSGQITVEQPQQANFTAGPLAVTVAGAYRCT